MINDSFVDMIHGFSDRVLSPLRVYLKRHSDNNRENQLLELILTKKEWEQNELCLALQYEAGAKGYYRCRNRLKEAIESVLVSLDHGHPLDKDKASRAFGIAQELLDENLWSHAAEYLTMAEKLAAEQMNYLLVRQIHAKQLDYLKVLKISPKELSQRMDTNKRLDNCNSKVTLMRSQIEADVNESRQMGITHDRGDFFPKLLKDFRITKKMMKDPWLCFNLCDIYRSAIKSKKEYGGLETFAKEVHKDLLDAGSYNKSNWKYHFSIVFIIGHACYRNLKFKETEDFCVEASNITTPQELKTHPYYFKYVSLTAAAASLTGKVDLAIEALQALMNDESALISDLDRLDFVLNLTVYYFQAGQFDKANTCIRSHDNTKTWLLEHKGPEWVFKKELIEVLIQFEMRKMDVARDWAIAMQKDFDEFFDHELYQYAAEYLRMLIYMIDHPEEINSEEFRQRIRTLSDNWPADRQDIQAISFLCWMKGKNRRREYYEVLMEWMEREKEAA